MPQPAPEPDAQNVPRQKRHISLAPLDDEPAGQPPASSKAQPDQDPTDYLESQLGLTASDIAPARWKTPTWRLRKERREPEKAREPLPEAPPAEPVAAPVAERVAERVVEPVAEPAAEPETPAPALAPSPVAREPRAAPPSRTPTTTVVVAAFFALLALALAALVHYFAPTGVAGYSPAEFDLKVQIRAVEWLLAGILVGIVGLLFKRG